MLSRFFTALIAIPLGLDLYLPVPEDNPITAEKIELWDDGCSSTAASRATARSPARPATIRSARSPTPVPVAIGVGVPSAGPPQLSGPDQSRLRSAFLLGWRVYSLEEQVLKPIQDPNEMDLTLAEASARVKLDAPAISRRLPATSAAFCRAIRRSTGSSTEIARRFRPNSSAGLQLFRGKGELHRVSRRSELH